MSCSRHSAGGTSARSGGLSSPSSIEFPSPVATSNVAATSSSSSSTTPTTTTATRNSHHHHRHHHHYHSPTRLYSPRSAISKIRNTFMHSTSTSSNNNNTSSCRMNAPENETLSTDASDNRHSTTTSRTPDRLNKFWAAYANWRSGGSSSSGTSSNTSNHGYNNGNHHRKGQQQQQHHYQPQQGTSTLSSSSSSGALPEMNHNLVATKVPMTAHKRVSKYYFVSQERVGK